MRRVGILCLLLSLVTFTLYARTGQFQFVNFDDGSYIVENPHVNTGLTWSNIAWAFTKSHSSNWHPLTWISHMLDVELFGLKNPGGHHLVNAALHAINAALLLLVLYQMTASVWRSAFVAALFALHPLHVESVAWVAERKDVLSTLFWLLTMLAYVRYVRRPTGKAYAVVMLVFVMGLLSKPMVVTLPCVLLLMDYWPLRRVRASWLARDDESPPMIVEPRGPGWLIIEKLPLLGLAIMSSVATFFAQRHGEAVTSIDYLTISQRLTNAIVAYGAYLFKMVWPTNLAIIYPHPSVWKALQRDWPLWMVLTSGAVLLIVTLWVIVRARTQRYMLVGWLWYLGTLVPVIGIVQVGSQAYADRYTYIPLVGIFIMIAWGATDLASRLRLPRSVPAFAGTLALVACVVLTHRQIGVWRNSVTLFTHALHVTRDNFIAHSNLASHYLKSQQYEQALHHYDQAIRIEPKFVTGYIDRAVVLARLGRIDEAIDQYNRVIEQYPKSISAHVNVGLVHLRMGQHERAVASFETALRADPAHVEARFNLGNALAAVGRFDQAIEQYRTLLEQVPTDSRVHHNLANALSSTGQYEQAARHYQLALDHGSGPHSRHSLASLLASLGHKQQAIEQYRILAKAAGDDLDVYRQLSILLFSTGASGEAKQYLELALRLQPQSPELLARLAWVLATANDDTVRDGPRAVALAEHACRLTNHGHPMLLDVLAAAYAQSRHFEQAIQWQRRAIELVAAGDPQSPWLAEARHRLQLYEQNQPYRFIPPQPQH